MKKQNKYRRRKAPASSRKPSRKLAARDVQISVEALVAFQRRLWDVFQRREQRDWFLFYLCGQLSNLERKTIEPMVLGLHGPAPQVIWAKWRIARKGSSWSTPARTAIHLSMNVCMCIKVGFRRNLTRVGNSAGFPKRLFFIRNQNWRW